MPGFRRQMLWSLTAKRRAYAARWLPWLLREDDEAQQKLDQLLQSPPARWINVLAGLPSTRWLAILRPHGVTGQHLCCGPTRNEVEDLGRVICDLQDDDWLQDHYPGPLNYAGQARLEQQSAALQRLLSRCVAVRQEAHVQFAVHVAGDTNWQWHHSPTWPVAAAHRTLVRAFEVCDIFPDSECEEHRLC